MKFTLTETDINGNPINTTEIDLDVTEKEMEEYNNLFCKCDYLEKHPNINAEYVEHYKGVNHGWICPKCKHFVQIG